MINSDTVLLCDLRLLGRAGLGAARVAADAELQ